MTKKDFVRFVADRSNVTIKIVDEMIDVIFDGIKATLMMDDEITIPKFGKFKVTKQEEGDRYNAMLQKMVHIEPKRKVKFSASSVLKDALNE